MNNIYFVSGHTDLTDDEFKTHYIPKLEKVLKLTPNAEFIMGDAEGADRMTQKYLYDNNVDKSRVTIYYRKDRLPPNPYGYKLNGPYDNYKMRDTEMTLDSDEDIVYLRDPETVKKMIEAQGKVYDPKFISGTQANIERRKNLKTYVVCEDNEKIEN